ncbi:amino acid ABC transporter permease [uncultured Herbaspirillum sp.]|uniref:amino acid ABC transporter permease n=1 Tax=uncultured Herbaspirillum sp. TaxID=160236 RepID=UPI0026257428|nr:amino acid ABC transporter permease [uncultured Herbaspirillum sp.]
MKDLLLANPDYQSLLAHGLLVTVKLFVTSWILAMLLASLLTAVRSTSSRLGQALMALFVEYHRNVPGLVQIFVWYFGMPQLLPREVQRWINHHDGEFFFSCIALTLYAAAYMSEDLRSGLRSLPRGQVEAARSLGMSYRQTLQHILLPQALRAALPPLVNQTLALFKATSLAMTVGVADVMHATRQIENETYRTFEAFLMVSVVYVLLSWLIMGAGAYASRRLNSTRN